MAKGFKMRKAGVPQYYASEIDFPKYRKGETVVLFDADILAFKVSSVCETKYRFTHKKNGDQYDAKSLTEFKDFLTDEKASLSRKIMKLAQRKQEDGKLSDTNEKRMARLRKELLECPEFEDFEREDFQVADPFEYCAKTLNDAYDRVMKRLKAKKSELYIGGDENFRSEIPLKEEYKVSVRKDGVRPIHLTPSKEYLIKTKGAWKIKGIEADDIIQMRAYQLALQGVKVYVYSNDKDRLQAWYANWYNPDNDEILTLDSLLGEITAKKKGSGLKWLMFQCSQGDPTDGYSPKAWYAKRYGQVGFYNDFNECDTVKGFLEKFIEVHRDRLLPEPLYEWDTWDGRHVKSNWLGIIEMMFSCAYMKLEIDDKRTFSSLCQEHGVDAGELVWEVYYDWDCPNEELGCVRNVGSDGAVAIKVLEELEKGDENA